MNDHNTDRLADLTTAEQIAKRHYDNALELLACCHRERAADPCQGTLDMLIQARKRVDRAHAAWEQAQEDFAAAWEEEYGWP
ncbi:hypothetical protein CCAX7_26340 [Capsulimonas corticalis]|uniref:Uncharacterized protein n=1 Tax=Capsulimonas corticalis TaxID=2219043 RepID=A0A402D6K9_9BACT|nr:hypothetical protein [Capsulimonas corticalis]BDI30583.1 hypothetical protein CCAX7_26340 [Capsulimonas corticalis]